MGLFNRSLHFNRLLLSALLVSFSINAIPHRVHALDINLNDAAFVYRLEQIVDKLYKLEKKGSIKSIIECGLDIKSEIEQYYNVNIDVNYHLNQLEKELNSKGYRFKKDQFKEIKNLFKKTDKKIKDHKGF